MKRRGPTKLSRVDSRHGKSGLSQWRRGLVAISAVVVLVASVICYQRIWGVGRLPELRMTGLEPAIVSVIQQGMEQVRRHPRSGSAWGSLGMILQHYEARDPALACFSQAKRLQGGNPRWPYWLGRLLATDNLHRAVGELTRTVALCGNDPEAPRLWLARALIELGKTTEAEQHFEALRKRNPEHAAARLGLAQIELARTHYRETTNLLTVCLSNPYTTRSANGLMAAVMRKMGQDMEASRYARHASGLPPDLAWPDPFWEEAEKFHVGRKALLDRAEQLARRGNQEALAPVLKSLVTQYPDESEGWLMLGRALLDQGKCEEAERACRKHVELKAVSVNGRFLMGLILMCLERYAEAAWEFSKVLEWKPDFGEAHFNLGFAQARSGLGREAIQSFREAIRCSPEFVDPCITLADLLHQSGEKTEAEQWLRRAGVLAPEDPRIPALRERWREL